MYKDQVWSFRCGLALPPTTASSAEWWEWSPETQKRLCSHLDELELSITFGNDGWFDGTWDTLKVDFGGLSEHLIVKSSPHGFSALQPINLRRIFSSDTVALGKIRWVRIVEVDTSVLKGADEWKLVGTGTYRS